MFDEGQKLPSAYHRTKFESEKIAREDSAVPFRVYRPAVVVGHSQTGVMDKVDGPYYFFKAVQKIRGWLPEWAPLIGPELGWTNVVPVDYVARAMDHIAHADGLDGQAFHLAHPKGQRSGDILNTFARAGHAPHMAMRIDKKLIDMLPKGTLSMVMKLPALKGVRDSILQDFGIPPEVIEHVGFNCQFDTRDTERALADSDIAVPELDTYATKLWDYWERVLDPDLYKDRSFEHAVNGKTVVITGASSGIGLSAALKIAKAGGIPILVARSMDKLEAAREEIERAGGTAYAYSADLSAGLDRRPRGEPARRPRVDRHAGQQRGPLDPPLDRAQPRPLPRLRAHRPAQLPRHDQADDGPAPAHARAPVRPRRQRVLDRRADQPAALQRLRGVEGRARCLDARGVVRGHRRQHHLHDHPHALGPNADDRADQDL